MTEVGFEVRATASCAGRILAEPVRHNIAAARARELGPGLIWYAADGRVIKRIGVCFTLASSCRR